MRVGIGCDIVISIFGGDQSAFETPDRSHAVYAAGLVGDVKHAHRPTRILAVSDRPDED